MPEREELLHNAEAHQPCLACTDDVIALQLDRLRQRIEAAKAELDVIIRSAHDRARMFGSADNS